MITRILVAYDASDASRKAVLYGLDIARRFQAEMEIIGVIRPPDFGAASESSVFVEEGTRQFEKHTHELQEEAHQAGVQIHTHLSVGHVAHEIITRANDHGFDLIIIGHRGKSLIQRWLTGSTAKQVMSYAHCPVLMVR